MSLVSSSSDDEEYHSPVGAHPFFTDPTAPSSSTAVETPRDQRGAKREKARVEQLALEQVNRDERRQARIQRTQDQQQVEVIVEAEPELSATTESDEADETLQVEGQPDEETPAGSDRSDQELERLSEASLDKLYSMEGDEVPAAAVPLPTSSGLLYDKLDPFTRRMDEDFNEWRDQYDLYSLTHRWPEET